MAALFQKGSSSSSCGTTPIYLSPISFLFAATELGYMAINAALLTAFTIATVIPTYRQMKRGSVIIAIILREIHSFSERESEDQLKRPYEIPVAFANEIYSPSMYATNHVHTVVTADRKPSLVLNAFKANATRQLREGQLWAHDFSPWADKGSKIRLWNGRSVARAIDYVLNGQGVDLPNFDD